MSEELFKDKSLLVLDELIYPNKLVDVLRKQIKEKISLPEFLGGDYVRLIVVCDKNEERLDKCCNEIQFIFKEYVEDVKSLIIDNEDGQEELISIEKQISNGINEKAFYDWFMRLTFQLRQITIPLDELKNAKKGYNPSSKIISFKYDNGLIANYIFFSSNGHLFNELTFPELIKKGQRLLKDKINNKKKNNNKRNPLDSRLRHECFKRDGYKCLECGATNKDKVLHCDHIVPVSQGGSDELDNLQTLCENCNLAKSNKKWEGGNDNKKRD